MLTTEKVTPPPAFDPASETGLKPRWPEPPCLIEEASLFGYRSRKIPESPRLAELARLAIGMGKPSRERY